MPITPHETDATAALEEHLKRLEGQLRQAQKMETLGQLTGGIAHDFNNLLTIIAGCAQVLLDELGAGDPLHAEAGEILKAAERAATLTAQLLRFSRKQAPQPAALDLNGLVANMESMLRRVLGEDIELEISLGPDAGSIEADPGRIEQIILNLAVNARDAMPAGGTLRIETSAADRDEHTAAGRRYAMLAVSDTGCGMDEETRSRLFEPFFTTKEAGRGTGLGLWTVYNVVQEYGGDIWVASAPGRGTTFRVHLPEAHQPIPAPKPEPAPREPAAARTETILLVEDGERVRKLVHGMLTRMGYPVLEAADGREAIRLAREHHGPVHLLLSDVVMPKMNGHELAQRLTAMLPGLRVVYMSGYMDNPVVHREVVESGAPFLQKPFTQDALARKIRDVLDGAALARVERA